MKKGDILWIFGLLIWVAILIIPESRTVFNTVTDAHPYLGGFIKFSILATMGDILGTRVIKGGYVIPKGIFFKAVVWGIIGMMVTLMFSVYMGGTAAAQATGRLPFKGSVLAQAFFGSTIMNVTFGPMMMVFHRFMDIYIDTKYMKNGGKVTMHELVDKNNWHSLVEFSWLKTCPFFWIPAHTVVFLLPSQYRVIISAFLSIALGLMMAFANKPKAQKIQPAV